jgi:hypothetical protein
MRGACGLGKLPHSIPIHHKKLWAMLGPINNMYESLLQI